MVRGEARHKKFAQMLADLATYAQPAAGAPATTCLLSQLGLGDNPGKVCLLKVIVPLPQMGASAQAETQRLIVADQNADVLALTSYALRGLPLLEPGMTLEVREPQLLRIEATKAWDASGAAGGGGGGEIAGFHLLRVETPSAQMRINGHPVHAVRARRPQRSER